MSPVSVSVINVECQRKQCVPLLRWQTGLLGVADAVMVSFCNIFPLKRRVPRWRYQGIPLFG